MHLTGGRTDYLNLSVVMAGGGGGGGQSEPETQMTNPLLSVIGRLFDGTISHLGLN